MGRRLLLAVLVAACTWPAAAAADTGILALGDFGVGGLTERETGA